MAFGSNQDLTGFTEVDPNGRIGATADRVTVTALTRNETAYLYDDLAGWFNGNFVHRLDLRITGRSGNGLAVFWALCNAITGRGDGTWDGNPALAAFVIFDGSVYRLYLQDYDGTQQQVSYVISQDTTYYLEVERDESVGTYGTLYLRIYPTAADRVAGANIITTLTATLRTKRDFRYLYAVATSNTASAVSLSGYAENYDLGVSRSSSGRGAHAALSARAGSGRGAHKCRYATYPAAGRGAHAAYNPFAAAGRGAHAVTLAWAAAARGLHAVLRAFPAAGRGAHAAYNAFPAAGRGRHARCIPFSALGEGLHRAANDALAGYELYVGVDGAPDFSAAPFEAFASLPHETAALDPAPAGTERTYHLVLRRRNAWNLATRNVAAWTVTVDDSGTESLALPGAPREVAVSAAAAGAVLVEARYFAVEDGAAAAGQWLVYVTDTGVDPDPAADEPTVVPMVLADGNARLAWTSDPFADGADVRVLVRARRVVVEADPTADPPVVEVDADSDNLDVYSTTADTDGPAAVTPASAFLGTLYGQAQ